MGIKEIAVIVIISLIPIAVIILQIRGNYRRHKEIQRLIDRIGLKMKTTEEMLARAYEVKEWIEQNFPCPRCKGHNLKNVFPKTVQVAKTHQTVICLDCDLKYNLIYGVVNFEIISEAEFKCTEWL